ncbi:MAG: elongation factor P [Candidatus Kapabacteria bacterium]|nr:elongation factor P [Candidatus Kapabacteria bacterium]MDW7997288.1 elongation factor P [Bacteroidota bacterium]
MIGTTSDLRVGAIVKYEGELYIVLDVEHRTPGNKPGFYQVKMRNLLSGRLLENKFLSGTSIEFARLERRPHQYLYRDGAVFVFMDVENYEQLPVDERAVGESARFLAEGQTVDLVFHEDRVVLVELPPHVNLRVVKTEPAVRGNTVTAALKPAVVETGATVQVPLFIDEGDVVRIDTRTGEYVERVKEA